MNLRLYNRPKNRIMAIIKLTTAQKTYLVSELEELVDNYEVYELDSPNNYDAILSLLTEMFNIDWNLNVPESIVDDYLSSFFRKELSTTHTKEYN